MKIETQEQAIVRLTEWQVEQGGISAQPASGMTEETERGWAFFNVNGYLGTVTSEGDVIAEPSFDDDDRA